MTFYERNEDGTASPISMKDYLQRFGGRPSIQLRRTEFDRGFVSTVFMAIPQVVMSSDPRPALWESMIYLDGDWRLTRRYHTEREALDDHDLLVGMATTMSPEDIAELRTDSPLEMFLRARQGAAPSEAPPDCARPAGGIFGREK